MNLSVEVRFQMRKLNILLTLGTLLASPLYGKEYISCADAVKKYVPKGDVREVTINEFFTQFELNKTVYHTPQHAGYVFMGMREEYKLADEFKADAVFINICDAGDGTLYDIWISKTLLKEI